MKLRAPNQALFPQFSLKRTTTLASLVSEANRIQQIKLSLAISLQIHKQGLNQAVHLNLRFPRTQIRQREVQKSHWLLLHLIMMMMIMKYNRNIILN